MNRPIRLFATGGTFDKAYDPIRGELYFKDTELPEMIRQGRCTLDIKLTTLMMVDSLDMADEQRLAIVENCESCDETRIVVTHGTDTIVQTAAAIAARVKNKTVVLTGALVPYRFGSSDGFFNLGSALAFAQSLPHGVHVAMNGRHFRWDNVSKDTKTGLFQERS